MSERVGRSGFDGFLVFLFRFFASTVIAKEFAVRNTKVGIFRGHLDRIYKNGLGLGDRILLFEESGVCPDEPQVRRATRRKLSKDLLRFRYPPALTKQVRQTDFERRFIRFKPYGKPVEPLSFSEIIAPLFEPAVGFMSVGVPR